MLGVLVFLPFLLLVALGLSVLLPFLLLVALLAVGAFEVERRVVSRSASVASVRALRLGLSPSQEIARWYASLACALVAGVAEQIQAVPQASRLADRGTRRRPWAAPADLRVVS